MSRSPRPSPPPLHLMHPELADGLASPEQLYLGPSAHGAAHGPPGEAAAAMPEPPLRPLRDYFDACFREGVPDADAAAGWADAAVPWAALRRSMLAADFAHGGGTRANCFTKSYGRYAKGTGSLLVQRADDVAALFAAVRAAAPEALDPSRPPAAAAEERDDDDVAAPKGGDASDAWPPGAPPLRCVAPLLFAMCCLSRFARLRACLASAATSRHLRLRGCTASRSRSPSRRT
jgi:hypothetical protein